MSTKNQHAPSWINLAEMWMLAHFRHKACVVFFHPVGSDSSVQAHMDLMQKHFSDPHLLSSIIHAEFAVLEVDDLGKANKICNETPQTLFTMVWHGSDGFVNENT